MKNKLNKIITGSFLAMVLTVSLVSAQTATNTPEVSSSSAPAVSAWNGGYRGYGMMGNWHNTQDGRNYNENASWRDVMPAFAAGLIGLGIVFSIIAILLIAFWVWMLVHAASSDIKDKPLWLLVIWFMCIVGAIIYFFVIKRRYDAEMKECSCEGCACEESEMVCACGKNETCQCHEEAHEEHHQK